MRDEDSQFIIALIKQTNKGEITQQIVEHEIELPNDEKITSKIYTTTILDKNFRLYEYQYKHYIDEDEWLWNKRKSFEVIDQSNNRLYEFEYDYSLNDLFESVTRKTSGIDDFLGNFLK